MVLVALTDIMQGKKSGWKGNNPNSRYIPFSDITIESIENTLASILLTLKPLDHGTDQDRSDYQQVQEILSGIANESNHRYPVEVLANSRRGINRFSNQELYDNINPGSDLGYLAAGDTTGGKLRQELTMLVASVFERYNIAELDCDSNSDITVKKWNPLSKFSLADIIGSVNNQDRPGEFQPTKTPVSDGMYGRLLINPGGVM
jgi:hypothetical protein